MKLLLALALPLLLTGCVSGDAVVAACEDATSARNALDCAGDPVNPANECGVLNDNPEAQAANPASPGAVRNCAIDPACGNAELLAFYECRRDGVSCDANDQPVFDPACDELIP